MTEGSEAAVFRDIGDGSDSLGVVADPGADLVAVVGVRVNRVHPDLLYFLFPADRQNRLPVFIFLQAGNELLF